MDPLGSTDLVGEVVNFCGGDSYLFTGLVNREFNSKFRGNQNVSTSSWCISESVGRLTQCSKDSVMPIDMYTLYHAYCHAAARGDIDALKVSLEGRYTLSYMYLVHNETCVQSCNLCAGLNIFELALRYGHLECAKLIAPEYFISEYTLESAAESLSIPVFQYTLELCDQWSGFELYRAIQGRFMLG